MPGKFRLAEVVPAALLVLGLFSSSFFLAEAAAQHHASKAQFALRHLGGFLANVSETATRPPVPGAPDVKGLTQELLDTAFRLAKDYPGRVEPLYVIGLVHQRTGRGAEACEYWRKCLDLNPRYADAYLGLAEVSFDKGEYEQTLALYQKGLSIYNHNPEIPINIGKTLIFLGRCDEAVRVLEQHLIEYPQAAPAHIYLGKAHLLEKQHEKAKSHYEKALQYDPNDEKAHYGLAIVYAKLGDEEKSDEHRRRFASLKSGSLSNLNERFRTYDDVRLVRRNAAFVYLKIGICHEICGNRAKAEEFLKKAAGLDTKNTKCRQLLASLHQKAGRQREALDLYQELTVIEPKNAVNFLYVGSLSAKLGQFEMAEAALQKVIKLAPERQKGYEMLATLYIQSGRKLPEAKRLATILVRKKTTAQNYFLLAAACSRNGDERGARAAMEQARRLDPGNKLYQGPSQIGPR